MSRQSAELARIESGPDASERLGGVGVEEVTFEAPGDSSAVIEKARDVMRHVAAAGEYSGTAPDLPRWFVEACAPSETEQERDQRIAQWRSLDEDAKARAEQNERWTLEDWLFWMDADERQWSWWDAHAETPTTGRILIEVQSWPTPTGALGWLLRASGASRVTAAF